MGKAIAKTLALRSVNKAPRALRFFNVLIIVCKPFAETVANPNQVMRCARCATKLFRSAEVCTVSLIIGVLVIVSKEVAQTAVKRGSYNAQRALRVTLLLTVTITLTLILTLTLTLTLTKLCADLTPNPNPYPKPNPSLIMRCALRN